MKDKSQTLMADILRDLADEIEHGTSGKRSDAFFSVALDELRTGEGTEAEREERCLLTFHEVATKYNLIRTILGLPRSAQGA